MKILILGGTGAMGRHLSQLLAEKDFQVVVTSRSQRSQVGRIQYRKGDAQDDGFLSGLLEERWDTIIDFMSYTTASFERRVGALLAATSHYIFLSSARVYANSEGPITEDSPRLLDTSTDDIYLQTDEYALSKARQENILFAQSEKKWTIIRPYITYGENRLQLGVFEKEGWLFRALQGRTIVLSEQIDGALTTLTYGLDAAKVIAKIVDNHSALGEAYQITSGETIRWSDVLAIYLRELESHLGYKPKVQLVCQDQFEKCHSARYQIIYDRTYNRVFSTAKIEALMGSMKYTEVRSGLSFCLETFLSSPSFSGIRWKSEAVKDKASGEFSGIDEIPGFRNKLRYLRHRLL